MKITRRKLKELLSETISEASYDPSTGVFSDDAPELYDIDNYDVEELASYHALNGDVDATLYRDNPDYRDAFIDMIVMKFGEERMQQFQGEEEEKEERRLLMDPDFDDPTEDDDLDDMGRDFYGGDYAAMLASEPYDIDESRYRVPYSNPGRSSREEMEIGDYGGDEPYYTSGPFEDEAQTPVLSPEEQEERDRREAEQRAMMRQQRAMMRRILNPGTEY